MILKEELGNHRAIFECPTCGKRKELIKSVGRNTRNCSRECVLKEKKGEITPQYQKPFSYPSPFDVEAYRNKLHSIYKIYQLKD
jgi:hypothetical protein